MSSQSTTVRSIIYLGMDVHKESITLAVLPAAAKSADARRSIPERCAEAQRYLERLAREGELRACYEASGAGYVLHRALGEWGYACEVIAPSLIPKRPGVQRKHDKYDASELARLYRPASSRRCAFRAKPRNGSATSCGVARRFSARSSSRATTS